LAASALTTTRWRSRGAAASAAAMRSEPIARTQACEDDYAPRHRRDVPAELDLRVAIAG